MLCVVPFLKTDERLGDYLVAHDYLYTPEYESVGIKQGHDYMSIQRVA